MYCVPLWVTKLWTKKAPGFSAGRGLIFLSSGHCPLVLYLGRSWKETKEIRDHRWLSQVLVGQDPLQNFPSHNPEIIPTEAGERHLNVSESSAAEVSPWAWGCLRASSATLLLDPLYAGRSLLLNSHFQKMLTIFSHLTALCSWKAFGSFWNLRWYVL